MPCSRLHKAENKSFGWNHKKVYRIDGKLGLGLPIQLKKKLAWEKPEMLVVPLMD